MNDYKVLDDFEQAQKNGTLPEMPESLDAKCRDLIDNAFGHTKRRSIGKTIGTAVAKIAMVVLLLLGLSTITVLSVDAFRVPVLNYLMHKSGKYSTILPEAGVQQSLKFSDPIAERFDSVIPENYRLVSQESSCNLGSITYENDNGHLLCLLFEADRNSINVDAENVEYTSVEYGRYYAVFWEKDGYHLMWLDDENQVLYRLWSNGLDKREFWKIAYALIA